MRMAPAASMARDVFVCVPNHRFLYLQSYYYMRSARALLCAIELTAISVHKECYQNYKSAQGGWANVLMCWQQYASWIGLRHCASILLLHAAIEILLVRRFPWATLRATDSWGAANDSSVHETKGIIRGYCSGCPIFVEVEPHRLRLVGTEAIHEPCSKFPVIHSYL